MNPTRLQHDGREILLCVGPSNMDDNGAYIITDDGVATITAREGMKGKKALQTLIHEAAHHACPDFTEEAVERIEAVVGKVIAAAFPEQVKEMVI